MCVDRQSPLGGEAEHFNHLQSSRPRRVLDAHSHCQAAGVKLRAQAFEYCLNLFRRRGLVRRRPALRQNLGDAGVSLKFAPQGCAEHLGSRGRVAGRRTVVDQRAALFGFQELCDVGNADFQLQSGGDAVEGLNLLALQLLAVLMQVDEARSHDEPADMNHTSSGQRLRRDADNFSALNANVPYGIQADFRIHNPAAFQHQVVLLRCHNR